MKKAALLAVASAVILSAAISASAGAASSFRKVTEHFYYLESKTGAANIGAMITTEGVLLVDPPPEPEIPAVLNALRARTDRAVRWVVTTNYQQAQIGGVATFLKQGAAIIGSKELDRLASSIVIAYPSQTLPQVQARPSPRFLFGGQLHLFPAGIEVRILAVKSKARTAGDVVVFVPSEKVLQVGDFFTPGSFPVIDSVPGEGSAPGWIDGLKQVVESVPLLKSAIPQPKQEPAVSPEPEKTPEEMVAVIPGHGDPSSMKEMKALLTVALKLRAEATRAVAAGRTREEFVKSAAQEASGGYANLEAFAAQLFDDLSKK
jgi:glyoxylase-like metal-dependent hydrolase (beta-lactamase superfamily II)